MIHVRYLFIDIYPQFLPSVFRKKVQIFALPPNFTEFSQNLAYFSTLFLDIQLKLCRRELI